MITDSLLDNMQTLKRSANMIISDQFIGSYIIHAHCIVVGYRIIKLGFVLYMCLHNSRASFKSIILLASLCVCV